MGYYPILKTSWKYFPEKKGFLTGFILCVFGLCPMVFTSVADYVINPDAIPMKDGIYPEEVAVKMKDFALIMSITMGACGLISQILMYPLDNIISTDKDENIKKNKEENDNNEKDEEEEDIKEKNKEIEEQQPFMQAFKSWRFHLFNFMSVGTLCKYIFILKIFIK